ncbi:MULTISPECIES: hypothetical protein [Providencia]|uniref:Uncharacterized protein n=2 Tax=Providencia TaxID=586 RepID=A0ABT9ASM6_9GAMM|nr:MULTISPECIES: hypothetical protein [Providencia]ELR5138129.1 hypothetical protein [Providencia rettgeri]ELR5168956.1 hypothetical protein [Providencia rettgeri]MBQ0267159.1 hypothetical protein [Providencia huaxiensis]MDO7829585.1 hypothetical protein [Providencia sp. CRE-138-0026]MDO7857623.1 hypothetical protein [Providencia sp. CRE-138-0111]
MYVGKNKMKNIKLEHVLNLFTLFPETVFNCSGDSRIATLEFDDEDVKKPT